MSTILIKSDNRENDNFFLKLAKGLHLKAKILTEDEQMDMLLIKSINEGMKSGEASKDEVKKMFGRHGIKI